MDFMFEASELRRNSIINGMPRAIARRIYSIVCKWFRVLGLYQIGYLFEVLVRELFGSFVK